MFACYSWKQKSKLFGVTFFFKKNYGRTDSKFRFSLFLIVSVDMWNSLPFIVRSAPSAPLIVVILNCLLYFFGWYEYGIFDSFTDHSYGIFVLLFVIKL